LTPSRAVLTITLTPTPRPYFVLGYIQQSYDVLAASLEIERISDPTTLYSSINVFPDHTTISYDSGQEKKKGETQERSNEFDSIFESFKFVTFIFLSLDLIIIGFFLTD